MTPACRAWTERFVAQLEARVALYARIGTGREGQDVIVGVLQWHIDRGRAALDAGAVAATPAPASVLPVSAPTGADRPSRMRTGTAGATSWDNPVFWITGRLDPFAGTSRDRMLASAAVCRSLGYEAVATLFEARAASADPADGQPCERRAAAALIVDDDAQARLATVTAFSAGPQLGLFG